MVITLSSIGLTGTNGFIGEFTILLGAFLHKAVYAVIASVGIILGAGYMLWLYQRVAFGKVTNPYKEHLQDMNLREVAAALPLVALVFWVGLYPNAAFTTMHASTEHLLQHVLAKSQALQTAAQAASALASREMTEAAFAAQTSAVLKDKSTMVRVTVLRTLARVLDRYPNARAVIRRVAEVTSTAARASCRGSAAACRSACTAAASTPTR